MKISGKEPQKIEQQIEELFNRGGLISGGAAVAIMFNLDYAKDLDFFFKDVDTYNELKEKFKGHNLFDICSYNSENPYDGFDLDITQCYIDKTGSLSKSKACKSAFDSKTISVIKRNVLTPNLTLLRLHNYSSKFNLKINQSDIEFLTDLKRKYELHQ